MLREEYFKRCHEDLTAYLRDKALHKTDDIATAAQHYVDSYGGTLSGKQTKKEKPSEVADPTDTKTCDVCKKSGHTSSTCWFKDQTESEKKCFKCGSSDHMIRECPKKKEIVGSSVISQEVNIGVNSTAEASKGLNPAHKYRDLPAEEISMLLNVPISRGKVNGKEVLVMRDSGFSFAAVRAEYVEPEQYLDEFEDLLLMDCTPRRFQKARIQVESEYFTGEVEVFVVENPVVDLVFGNITDRSMMDMKIRSDTTVQTEYSSMEDQQQCYEHRDGTIKEAHDSKQDSEIRKIDSSAAAITRSQKRTRNSQKSPLVVPTPETVDTETFREFQRDDPNLQKYWKMVGEEPKATRSGNIRYQEKSGLLYRVFKPKKKARNPTKQLLVPQKLTMKVLAIAHDGLLSGHCGIKRTTDRVMSNFYWADVTNDVKHYLQIL